MKESARYVIVFWFWVFVTGLMLVVGDFRTAIASGVTLALIWRVKQLLEESDR